MKHGSHNRSKPILAYVACKLPANDKLRLEINKSFEDPEQYLNINSFVKIGPRRDANFNIIPHSIVGSVKDYEEGISKRNRSRNSLKYSSKSLLNQSYSIEESKDKQLNYDIVDDIKINSLFTKFKILKIDNETKTNEFMNSVPEIVTNRLKTQEHQLNFFKDKELQFNKMVKKIAVRTKKNEDKVLMNIIDSQRIKKEYYEMNETKQTGEYKLSTKYNWNLSLRKPKDFKGTMRAFVNLGSDRCPRWGNIKDNSHEKVEIIRKPNFNDNTITTSHNSTNISTNNTSFYKTKFNTTNIREELLNIQQNDQVKDIKITGQDLLKVEQEYTHKMKGKKILYNKIYINAVPEFQKCHRRNMGLVINNPNTMNPIIFASDYEKGSELTTKK